MAFLYIENHWLDVFCIQVRAEPQLRSVLITVSNTPKNPATPNSNLRETACCAYSEMFALILRPEAVWPVSGFDAQSCEDVYREDCNGYSF